MSRPNKFCIKVTLFPFQLLIEKKKNPFSIELVGKCNTRVEDYTVVIFCLVGPHGSSKFEPYASVENYMIGIFSWNQKSR